MKTFLFAVLVPLSAASGTQAVSQKETGEDAIIRKASFTISAFECAALGKGTAAETERLFNAGMTAGREIITFFKAATPKQLEVLSQHIPMIWGFAVGPTPDFQLGRLYQAVDTNQEDNDVMRKFIDPKWHETKPDEWDRRRKALWREKNCQHVGSGATDAAKR
jgi:hypothetical protein